MENIETNRDLLEKDWVKDVLDDLEWEKMIGEPNVGCKVLIEWKNRLETDKGYSFSLPNCIVDELDFFIHIPSPDNSDGIGKAPEVYIHISQLISIEDVSKVRFFSNT